MACALQGGFGILSRLSSGGSSAAVTAVFTPTMFNALLVFVIAAGTSLSRARAGPSRYLQLHSMATA